MISHSIVITHLPFLSFIFFRSPVPVKIFTRAASRGMCVCGATWHVCADSAVVLREHDGKFIVIEPHKKSTAHTHTHTHGSLSLSLSLSRSLPLQTSVCAIKGTELSMFTFFAPHVCVRVYVQR